MSRLRIPCRRWVGRTPTSVTPAAVNSPPGTVRASRKSAAVADHRLAVEGGEHPLALENTLVALGVLRAHLLGEGSRAGLEEAPDLVRLRHADVDFHAGDPTGEGGANRPFGL